MPLITIAGTPIEFPNTGNSPIWSDAVIQFAQAVELALSGLIGPGDIGKHYFPLTSGQNPVSNLTVVGLFFDPLVVRSAFVRYYVYRTTTATKVAEAGTMTMVYNPDNSAGSKWEVSRQFIGDAEVTLTMLDSGQVQITTTAIAGSNHSGTVGFVAQVLEV